MRIRKSHDLTSMLRERRLDLGMTPEEVGARSGLSAAWVSDVEAGRVSVDLASALRVLDVLDIHLEAGIDAGAEIPQWAGGVVDLDQVLTRYLEWAPPDPEPTEPRSSTVTDDEPVPADGSDPTRPGPAGGDHDDEGAAAEGPAPGAPSVGSSEDEAAPPR